MYCKRFCFVAVAAAAFAVLLGTMGRPALAERPAVPRLFAEWTSPEASCRDWEGEDSRRIVAHRDGTSYAVIEFGSPAPGCPEDRFIVRDDNGNVILDLTSTTWLRLPVVHVTSSGVEEVRLVFWLAEDVDGDGEIDLPGPGMTTATGPDGDVAHFVTIRVAQASISDDYNPNKYYLFDNGNTQLCIATGLFNK